MEKVCTLQAGCFGTFYLCTKHGPGEGCKTMLEDYKGIFNVTGQRGEQELCLSSVSRAKWPIISMNKNISGLWREHTYNCVRNA